MALVCGIRQERFSELYWKLRPPYDRGDIDGPAYSDSGCWPARTGLEQRSDSNANQARLRKYHSTKSRRGAMGKALAP